MDNDRHLSEGERRSDFKKVQASRPSERMALGALLMIPILHSSSSLPLLVILPLILQVVMLHEYWRYLTPHFALFSMLVTVSRRLTHVRTPPDCIVDSIDHGIMN